MSISDHGAQFQEKDESGVFRPIYPITKVEYVEGNIVQYVNGQAPDEDGNVTCTLNPDDMPVATNESIGGVILGDTLTSNDSGIINVTGTGVVSALGYTPISEDTVNSLLSTVGSEFKIIDNGTGDIDIVSLQGNRPVVEQR